MIKIILPSNWVWIKDKDRLLISKKSNNPIKRCYVDKGWVEEDNSPIPKDCIKRYFVGKGWKIVKRKA